ncbi:hypothetical protein ACN47E_007768 [Coniothyrium glycines]
MAQSPTKSQNDQLQDHFPCPGSAQFDIDDNVPFPNPMSPHSRSITSSETLHNEPIMTPPSLSDVLDMPLQDLALNDHDPESPTLNEPTEQDAANQAPKKKKKKKNKKKSKKNKGASIDFHDPVTPFQTATQFFTDYARPTGQHRETYVIQPEPEVSEECSSSKSSSNDDVDQYSPFSTQMTHIEAIRAANQTNKNHYFAQTDARMTAEEEAVDQPPEKIETADKSTESALLHHITAYMKENSERFQDVSDPSLPDKAS